VTDTITNTLRQCHEIVWSYRKQLEEYWPTPCQEHALLFAHTELSESIDAFLRGKPEYARNNDKDLDVLEELADCALMVLTAVGPDFEDAHSAWGIMDWHDKWYGRHEWSVYAVDMAELLYWQHHGDLIEEGYPLRLVQRIATHPGMDLPQRLKQRLERIKAKRWREKSQTPVPLNRA
jgi:hypothetical protein